MLYLLFSVYIRLWRCSMASSIARECSGFLSVMYFYVTLDEHTDSEYNPKGSASSNCQRFTPVLVRRPPCAGHALFDLPDQYLFSQVHAFQLTKYIHRHSFSPSAFTMLRKWTSLTFLFRKALGWLMSFEVCNGDQRDREESFYPREANTSTI